MEGQATTEAVKNQYPSLDKAMGIVKEESITPTETPVVAAPVAATPTTPVENPAKAEFNIDELTDDQINELIAKKTGGKVKSLSELNKPEPKTKEELEKEQEKRDADALSWAIETGKVKMVDYDNSIKGQAKTDREIVLADFIAEVQAEDKEITIEEAEEMFKDAYHEHDDTSKLYKIGQKEIKRLADIYRKSKYSLPDYKSEYNETIQAQEQYKN